jgi:hypothetical protein
MLKLEVIWKDSNLIECQIQARKGSFAAAADVYFTAKLLSEFADTVAGFPILRRFPKQLGQCVYR